MPQQAHTESETALYYLEIIEGRQQGLKIPVTVHSAILGRSRQCDVTIKDDAISRHHCQLHFLYKGKSIFRLEDLNSRNGVLLNGVKVNTSLVYDGDHIRIGETVLIARAIGGEQTQDFQTTSPIKASDTDSEQLIAAIEISDSDKFDSLPVKGAKVRSFSKLGELLTLPNELDVKLQAVLALIMKVVHAESGCILIQNPLGDDFTPIATLTNDSLGIGEIPVSWTIINRAIEEKIGILAADASNDPRFEASESVEFQNIRSVICVPLYFQNSLKGVIFLNSTQGSGLFIEEDLFFLNELGNFVAMGIAHHQLMESHINREKMAEVGDLVAGLSHYIKNILFALHSSQGIVRNSINENDLSMLEKTWPIVDRSIARIGDLVKDMLYFAKDHTLEFETQHIHDTIEEMLELYTPLLKQNGIDLILDFGKRVPASKFNAPSLQRVFLNILTNAIDSMSETQSPQLKIRTRFDLAQHEIVIEIADNGKGIPPQYISKIFHYLFSTKGAKGTGLGLHICKTIVEKHGGSISVASQLGEGTTFFIRLPVIASIH